MKFLTDEELKKDLDGFYVRLADARYKLGKLPSTADSWIEQKKLKEKKRILHEEIKHVRRLIAIGQEALNG